MSSLRCLIPDQFRTAASAVVLAWVGFASVLGGCQRTLLREPALTQKHAGAEPETQVEFWHQLQEAPVVGHDDAFHAVLLWATGTDTAKDYDQRIQALINRGSLPGTFNRPANEAITRGTLAVILANELKIEGGVLMQLIGGPRYATRELQAQGVYPASSPQQIFSGSQFVSVIGRAEDYQRMSRR